MGTDKADQTELRRRPVIQSKILQDDQTEPWRCLQNRSNRVLKSLTNTVEADKADQTELRRQRVIQSQILQADQTEPWRCLQSRSNRVLKSLTNTVEADKADQTELRRRPDIKIFPSRSNRASEMIA
ncbi:hypothetical protein JCGZ_02523 [Jatropha curcas]|uniref:Uncharacterized protein n=1 Tax=Jatropha curcas TaxID=180498 RepID=A0A067JG02_JATCU|nr:hypothetical protein JCGZ_02523 [Jatropha curcas]